MPSPIEIALSSLLPTVSYLPPELISLSTSLLAQSKSKASALKPEEEIGRTYACCHIACQRLGHKLALEIAKPSPPVKPKVYSKLHTYLNSVLKTTATPRTPRKTEERESGARPSRTTTTTTAESTPSKPKHTTSTTPSRKRSASALTKHTEAGVPDWTKPIIRLVCNANDSPQSIPHIFAGLSSILSHLNYPSTQLPKSKRRKLDPNMDITAAPTSIHEDQITNLIIAIFTVVYNIENGQQNVDDWDLAVDAGRALKAAETGVQAGGEGWEVVELTYEDNPDMMGEIKWFKDSIRSAWKDQEWISNIPVYDGPTRHFDDNGEVVWTYDGLSELVRPEFWGKPLEERRRVREGRRVEGSKRVEGETAMKRAAKTPLMSKEKRSARGEGDEVGAAGLLPGLGTMFQPAVDWLSDERVEEFERWKEGVLKGVPVGAV